MPRVVPSDVVKAIDRMFPGVKDRPTDIPNMSPEWVPSLTALADLAEAVPDELLYVLDPTQYADLRAGVAFLRGAAGVFHSPRTPAAIPLRLHGYDRHPVAIVRDAMLLCPDEAPDPHTTELSFITDAALRKSIRLDISAAHSGLSQAEWKGATVLAGAAIEALLLWALQEHETKYVGARAAAIATLRGSPTPTLTREPNANIERWGLHEYLEVAAHLGIIRSDTATLVRLAKDFRNLIHPGRAARTGQQCDKPTAHGALAAVLAVARDLTP
jgi:hypothetical protein